MEGRRRSSGLADGTIEEGTEDVLERDTQESMEEGNEMGESCWQSSCLAKFSRCLGMPTEGFEGEILFLLKRMKEMKFQKGKKGKLDGRKKRIGIFKVRKEVEKAGMDCELSWRSRRGRRGSSSKFR